MYKTWKPSGGNEYIICVRVGWSECQLSNSLHTSLIALDDQEDCVPNWITRVCVANSASLCSLWKCWSGGGMVWVRVWLPGADTTCGTLLYLWPWLSFHRVTLYLEPNHLKGWQSVEYIFSYEVVKRIKRLLQKVIWRVSLHFIFTFATSTSLRHLITTNNNVFLIDVCCDSHYKLLWKGEAKWYMVLAKNFFKKCGLLMYSAFWFNSF